MHTVDVSVFRWRQGIAEANEDPLTVLSNLIVQVESHHVDQVLRISDLLWEDQPVW